MKYNISSTISVKKDAIKNIQQWDIFCRCLQLFQDALLKAIVCPFFNLTYMYLNFKDIFTVFFLPSFFCCKYYIWKENFTTKAPHTICLFTHPTKRNVSSALWTARSLTLEFLYISDIVQILLTFHSSFIFDAENISFSQLRTDNSDGYSYPTWEICVITQRA